MLYFLLQRLRQKTLVLLPILIGSGLFFGLMVGVFWLAEPWLPSRLTQGLAQIDLQNPASLGPGLQQIGYELGAGSAWTFLILQGFQVIFAPIPGQVMGLLGGYLFGFGPGLALTMLGLGLGSLLVMLLGRYAGQTLLHRFVPKIVYARFEYLIDKGGLSTFFMIFLLPGLPDDAVCFIAGLSHLRLLPLWIACLLGRLPGMALLSWTGASLDQPSPYLITLLWILGLLSFLVWFFQPEIEGLFSPHRGPKEH